MRAPAYAAAFVICLVGGCWVTPGEMTTYSGDTADSGAWENDTLPPPEAGSSPAGREGPGAEPRATRHHRPRGGLARRAMLTHVCDAETCTWRLDADRMTGAATLAITSPCESAAPPCVPLDEQHPLRTLLSENGALGGDTKVLTLRIVHDLGAYVPGQTTLVNAATDATEADVTFTDASGSQTHRVRAQRVRQERAHPVSPTPFER